MTAPDTVVLPHPATPFVMIGAGLLSAAIAVLLVLLVLRRSSSRARLRSVVRLRRPRRDQQRVRVWTNRAGAGLGGMAVALVVGGWAGLAVGFVAAVGAHRVLTRLEPARARAERLRAEEALPLAADLLAAALNTGVPTGRAAEAVAEALGGPLGERFARVGRALRLGATADEAWAYLGPVAGAERLIRAAVRSSESGLALAGMLTRLADDLRAARAAAGQARARRAGVLIVLPLGLCFLPAFVLAGLVPVIVALLGDVL